jgi:hypothetical protein
VDVPGIGDGAEDAPAVRQRGPHLGQAVEKSLGGFAGSSAPSADGASFPAPLVGEEDKAGFEPQPVRRGVRPGVQ